MKFFHSADWQLGARFAQFGAKAAGLREARLRTLKAALKSAHDKHADAFLIAGDLFENNQVEDSLVVQTLRCFAEFPDLPILILPGNHDPYTGPGCVWSRPCFSQKSSNVSLLLNAASVSIADACVLASPLTQKRSMIDPSLALVELSRSVPAGKIKIGVTHGSLAIPSSHEPDDFPIALKAASRAGLDYLAVGHWHNWLVHEDGRLVMPGTPEPDRFGCSGGIAFVQIDAPGAVPRIEKICLHSMTWEDFTFDFLNLAESKLKLKRLTSEFQGQPEKLVLRITLTGSISPALLHETKLWLEREFAGMPYVQVVDQSIPALSEVEIQQLYSEHQLAGQILNDLARMEQLLLGHSAPCPQNENPISLNDVQVLLGNAKIDFTRLKPSHLRLARDILLQRIQESKI